MSILENFGKISSKASLLSLYYDPFSTGTEILGIIVRVRNKIFCCKLALFKSRSTLPPPERRVVGLNLGHATSDFFQNVRVKYDFKVYHGLFGKETA